MGLYDNNLFYVVLCTSVLMLQVLWLLLPSGSPAEVTSRSRELLTFAVCSVLTALTASSFFRLFPGNALPPAEDSSVFLYIGKRMLEGKLPYRDLFDHKGPILYFIEYLGLRLSHGKTDGVWILEVLNLLWTSALMFRLGLLAANNRSSCYLAVMMTVIVCGWKVWQGGNFTEEYALPWITMTALVFFRFFQTGSYRLRDIFMVGFSFAVVFLLRANMIAVWAAYLPLVLVFFLREKQYSNLGKCAALFVLGISVVFLPVLVWAEKSGVLPELWEDYILFNFCRRSMAGHGCSALMPGFRLQEQRTVAECPVLCHFIARCEHECAWLLSLCHYSSSFDCFSSDNFFRFERMCMVPTV